ncbi:MAG: MbnP family protein [Bacteroidota bacterium]
MKILKIPSIVTVTLIFTIFLNGCGEQDKPVATAGLKIRFQHKINDGPLEFNKMNYTNTAGNVYEISEVMYFISDLKLYLNNGSVITPEGWDDIHYVDPAQPETLEWLAANDIPVGTYDSLTFTFGLSAEKNQPFIFVNPPEVNMAWPEVLGGGYHYMMINGWWIDLQGIRKPFNFHLGIGQIYANNSGDPDDITGFIHNDFIVNPGGGSFTSTAGNNLTCTLTMNIESWFDTPVVYDHNQFGGAIMQNQVAMHTASLNGRDVFSITWE